MIKTIPFFSSLVGEGTMSEILLYGLIETLSIREGFCYASSDYMAEQLGLSVGTIKNLLTSLRNKSWVEVTVEGNKRIAIQPLLGIKPTKKAVEKPVENSARASRRNDTTVTEKLRYRHAEMTLSPDTKQGSDIIDYNKEYKKEINKEKNEAGVGLALKEPATANSRTRASLKRNDFESEDAWYRAICQANTIKL